MGLVFTDDFGVRDFVVLLGGDIVVADDLESFSSLDALVFGSFRSVTSALEQASLFVGIRLVPHVLVFRVASQLEMFKGFARDSVHDRHGPVVDEVAG